MVDAYRHINPNNSACNSDKLKTEKTVALKIAVIIARQGHDRANVGAQKALRLLSPSRHSHATTVSLSQLLTAQRESAVLHGNVIAYAMSTCSLITPPPHALDTAARTTSRDIAC